MLDKLYADRMPPAVMTTANRPDGVRGMPTGDIIKKVRASGPASREPVGSVLRSKIERITSIKAGSGCKCKTLADQMDIWGIAGCESRRDEIIDQLVANRDVLVEGLKANNNWLVAAGVALAPDAALRFGAGWLLDQAIADVRSQRRPVKPQKHIRAGKRKTLASMSGATATKNRSVIPVVFRKRQDYRWAAFGTVSGRKVESWQTTVASVIRAGWEGPHLFVEPDVARPDHYAGSWTHRPATITPAMFNQLGPGGKFGALQNYAQSLNDVLKLEPHADMFLYFQDDILCPVGLREALECVSWPDNTALLSLWRPSSPAYCCGDVKSPGLCKTPNSSIMGAQAYVMPRSTVEMLATSKVMHEWGGRPRGGRPQTSGYSRRTFDFATGEALYAVGRSYFYFTDSIVDHFEPVPGNSSIGNAGASKGVFRSFQFIGQHATAVDIKQHYGHQPIHVVILGVDLPHLTVSCIEAVKQSTIECHICYVDNGSTDDTRQQVYAALQGISHEIIENTRNMRYTFAAQQGIDRRAGRHVLMLNNDCRVKPDTIEKMLHTISGNKVASVCPTSSDKSTCSASKKENQGTGLREVSQLPWFCCLLHRDAINALPTMPTGEVLASGLCLDYWWSEQLKKQGWKHYINREAYAEHDHHATFTATGINLTPDVQRTVMDTYKEWKQDAP